MADNKPDTKSQSELNALKQKELELTQKLKTLQDSIAMQANSNVASHETIASLHKEILKTQQEYINVASKAFDEIEKQRTTHEEIAKIEEKGEKTGKAKEAHLKKIGDLIDDYKDKQQDIQDLSKQILSTDTDRLEIAETAAGISEMLAASTDLLSGLAGKSVVEFKTLSGVFAKVDNLGKALLKNEQMLVDAETEASNGKAVQLNMADVYKAKQMAELAISNTKLKQDKELHDSLEDMITQYSELILKQEESNDYLRHAAENAEAQKEKYKDMAGVLDKGFSKLNELVEKVPGGDFLLKQFGLDKIQGEIKEKVGSALSNVVSGFKTGGVGGVKSMISAVGNLGKAMLMGPQVAIFAMVAAVGLLIDLFMDLDAGVSEVQKELGGTKKQAIETHEAAHDMAEEMHLVGVHAKEVTKALADVSEIMGGVDLKKQFSEGNPAVKEMVQDATLLTQKFGLSKDELESVHSLSVISGKSMSDLAGEAIKVAGGVMSTKNAVKLLGGIAKDVAIAFKGSTNELIAAAAKAKMLGTDLKQVQAIGDGMMDIESSLTKEMEARAIIGKDINLDAARAAALNGDVATLQDELLKQAGSLEEYHSMNRIQQKAMADAMGMSVDQMTGMLGKAEEMNKLGLDKQLQDDLANATAAERAEIYKKQAGMLEGENKELALRKAQEEESASAAEKLGDMMTKIKETATKLATPLIDFVSAIMDGATASGGILDIFDGIIAVVKPLFDIMIGIGKVIFTVVMTPLKLVFAVLEPILDAVKDIFSQFGSGEGTLGGISGIFDSIVGTLSGVLSTVTGIVKMFIGGLLEPAKVLLKTVLSPIMDIFGSIFHSVSDTSKPMEGVNETGKKTVGIVETIQKVFSALKPIITIVGTTIANFIVRPFEIVGDLVSMVVKIFKGDLAGAAASAGDMIFKILLGIPKMLLTAITGIIDSIFGTNLTKSITDIFDFIQNGFEVAVSFVLGFGKAIFNNMSRVGKIISDVLLAPFNLVWDVGKAIVKMFQGDFMGGLTDIGKAVMEYIMTPFNAVADLIKSIISTVSDLGGVASKAFSSIKGMLPSWLGGDDSDAKDSGQKPEATSKPEQIHAAAANGGDVAKGGMMLVGERGPEVVTMPQGASIASTGATAQTGAILKAMGIGDDATAAQPSGQSASAVQTVATAPTIATSNIATQGAGGQASSGGTDMSNVEKKLDTLINVLTSVTSQPQIIKFGEKTVEEIKNQLSFKKSYTVGIDNTYGRTT